MHSNKTINFIKNSAKNVNNTLNKNQVQARLFQTAFQGMRATSAVGAMNGMTTRQVRMPSVGMLNLKTSIPSRSFASYPDHLKLEMPNLSPTMEKVSYNHLNILTLNNIGKHRSLVQTSWRQSQPRRRSL